MLDEAIHSLAYALGRPAPGGLIRTIPEDFRVTEIPLLEPDGEGEHVWLWIRKRNENTPAVATRLAACAGVHPRQVSYAGMKDRRAVTEQWFSVQLPGREEPDWTSMNSESVSVLRHVRHSRKLRRGTLKGNHFRIRLRDIEGDRGGLEKRLALVAGEGVPNYFGEQRFGRNASNLHDVRRLFANPRLRLSRNRRSLALSAARSLLFNRVLSRRVADGSWNTVIEGDALQLDGSHSFFAVEAPDAELAARVRAQDVHPTGPLYGRGESPARGVCRALEQAVLADFPDWCAGLEAAGLRADRRALRLRVQDLAWTHEDNGDLQLEFELPAGAYATSVLRELLQTTLP